MLMQVYIHHGGFRKCVLSAYTPMADSTDRHGTVTLDSHTGARGAPHMWETLRR